MLDEEGHDAGKAHGFFFIIGKAGDALSLDERLSLAGRLEQNTRAMTNGGGRLAGIAKHVVRSQNQQDFIAVSVIEASV